MTVSLSPSATDKKLRPTCTPPVDVLLPQLWMWRHVPPRSGTDRRRDDSALRELWPLLEDREHAVSSGCHAIDCRSMTLTREEPGRSKATDHPGWEGRTLARSCSGSFLSLSRNGPLLKIRGRYSSGTASFQAKKSNFPRSQSASPLSAYPSKPRPTDPSTTAGTNQNGFSRRMPVP